MRKQTFKVMDGKVDLTAASLAKVKLPKSTKAQDFLRDRLGYTDARLKDLFGEVSDPAPVQSIAGVSA